MWHYVALCGTMWHYSCKKQKMKYLVFLKSYFFCIVALRGTMWHYSCIKPKIKYIMFLINVFCFALCHYVALCGTMWHYSYIKQKNKIHCVFDEFWFCLHSGTMWHYVALFLSKAKFEIHVFFINFVFFLGIVALCGTMWHYSYIKQKIKYIVVLINLGFFCIVALCGTM